MAVCHKLVKHIAECFSYTGVVVVGVDIVYSD